ncbi:hypothetical protein EMCG_03908 [[Emmonsia] crescens]|uniref:BTB domain-containing protein n=1 Tax=[Emmonsia] crescens TaxID=73230 RepID=A0A0G2HTM1_9EURO|nr:hypothetical protein EMCG_03908 [Emmonsia crescens UAMH 3008]
MSSLEQTLSRICETGLFSDLTLHCQSKTFAVHRCIVCLQSEFFNKGLTGEFKEASTPIFNLDDDPFIVGKMVQYLYGANYDDGSEGGNNISSESGNGIGSGSRNPAEINTWVISLQTNISYRT